MNKKHLWIIIGSIAVLVPIIITLCINLLLLKDEPVEIIPLKVINGGTIQPADDFAAKVDVDEDGTTETDALYEYKSSYGYSLQYNCKYRTDFSGSKGDFYISNDSGTVNVAVQPMAKSDDLAKVQTKDDWNKLIEKTGLEMGECLEFNRTKFNGMDILIANYNAHDGTGKNYTDILMAMLIGDEYVYNYIYTAQMNASETEKTQIGGILYTIMQ